jgi:hypothetical protein
MRRYRIAGQLIPSKEKNFRTTGQAMLVLSTRIRQQEQEIFDEPKFIVRL